jgi:hypothetical protein
MTPRTDRNDTTDPADIADSSDSTENDDPMLNADAKDPTDPMDKAEPTDPIDRRESCDHRDHFDDGFMGPFSYGGSSAQRGHPGTRLPCITGCAGAVACWPAAGDCVRRPGIRSRPTRPYWRRSFSVTLMKIVNSSYSN